MAVNIFTAAEREDHDCITNCPPYSPAEGFPEHGEARQCPHGRWFVASVSTRPVYGGQMAKWRPATFRQRMRINRIVKEKNIEERCSATD